MVVAKTLLSAAEVTELATVVVEEAAVTLGTSRGFACTTGFR